MGFRKFNKSKKNKNILLSTNNNSIGIDESKINTKVDTNKNELEDLNTIDKQNPNHIHNQNITFNLNSEYEKGKLLV